MDKFLKFATGLAIGAASTAALYALYQQSEESLRVDLVDVIRDYFSSDKEQIEVVWLFDEPVREGVFAGGLSYEDGRCISFEIEEKSYHIIKNVTVDN